MAATAALLVLRLLSKRSLAAQVEHGFRGQGPEVQILPEQTMSLGGWPVWSELRVELYLFPIANRAGEQLAGRSRAAADTGYRVGKAGPSWAWADAPCGALKIPSTAARPAAMTVDVCRRMRFLPQLSCWAVPISDARREASIPSVRARPRTFRSILGLFY